VREGDAERPVIIMAPRAAVHLATLTTLDGAPLFPNLGPLGGTIMGVPVLTTPAAGNKVILIDASCLIVTDEGLLIDRTEHASVELSDSPSSPSTLVSGFQGNLALLKVTRYLHWTFTAADAVAYLELTDLASSPA
jgi:hypothetical protein